MASAADRGFRILLLDQRGTGLSAPVSPASLDRMFPCVDTIGDDGTGGARTAAEGQAAYLSHFRADSIAWDIQMVRLFFYGATKGREGGRAAAAGGSLWLWPSQSTCKHFGAPIPVANGLAF